VRRCLEKRPERRFQLASDLAFTIAELSHAPAGTGTTSAKKRLEALRAEVKAEKKPSVSEKLTVAVRKGAKMAARWRPFV
jgi:hypothetical protein